MCVYARKRVCADGVAYGRLRISVLVYCETRSFLGQADRTVTQVEGSYWVGIYPSLTW